MLLAIETSCDETGVAILRWDERRLQSGVPDVVVDLVSSQIALHQPYGGVVPELAAREHITNLPVLYNQAMAQAGISIEDISLICVTQGPGLKGCLLVGLCFAKALAYGAGKPISLVNHLEGHLFAFQLMEEASSIRYPILALLVSGGHTYLIMVRAFRDYEIIACTRDDAAGEAFDKTATLLGLPYPGGPALSKTAQGGDRFAFEFPRSLANDDSGFSFSGFKTAVLRTVERLGDEMKNPQVIQNLSASIEHSIVDTLLKKTENAIRRMKPASLLITGGVAANGYLRERLNTLAVENGLSFIVPPRKWCTDNAAMIGAVGFLDYKNNKDSYDQWGMTAKAENSDSIGPFASIYSGALPRHPLS